MLNDFFDTVAPPFRVRYNVSPLIDIPNGPIMRGPNGESYYAGGLQAFAGITARGNTFKSTLGQFISKRVLARYNGSDELDYDTEETIDMPRIDSLTLSYTGKHIYDFQDDGRFGIVNKANYLGNDFYKRLKDYAIARTKKKKPLTVPFVYREGKPLLKVIPPLISFVDSLSQFSTESVEAIQDKNEIGESSRNTEALRDAGAKSQMINELPHVTVKNNLIVLCVAHLGEKHQLDPMAPPMKQFAYLKQGFKLKRVSENFTFLTNNLWAAVSGSVLNNQGTKASEYPAPNDLELPGDTDLNEVHYFDLRSKGGSSGVSVPMVFSQRHGFLEGVTMWHLLKTHKQWGLIPGHNSYATHLYPKVFANRKQIRAIYDKDEKFRRALELTCEARLLEMFHPEVYYELSCPMDKLYSLIEAKGYDWDRLLMATRSYWVWHEEEGKHPLNPLTVVDLWRMVRGEYHPKWYGKLDAPKAEDLEKALSA